MKIRKALQHLAADVSSDMNNLKMDLSLTNNEIQDFLRVNVDAREFHSIASEDYIAARCCWYNTFLDQGYILATQAIEKELKSILIYLDPSVDIKSFKSHRLEPLIQKIQVLKDLGLNKYQKIGKKLSDVHELQRYPNNKLSEKIIEYGFGGHETDEIDEFVFYLLDIHPFPTEVKFRIGLYASILHNRTMNLLGNPNTLTRKNTHWAILNNKAFNKRKNSLYIEHEQVINHLFKNKTLKN